jgi:hypothetical protein
MADNTINTRKSVASTRKTSGIVASYTTDSLLSGRIAYVRGRRFATCEDMSDPINVYSRPSNSGGGK